MIANFTINTSTWDETDAKLMRMFTHVLEQKRNTAEISGAPKTKDIITHETEKKQDKNVSDTHDAHFEQMRFETSETSVGMEDALHELGLGLSGDAHPKKLSCKITLEKWFSILGYEDFKSAINAIHKAWPKYYKGLQWNRLIVKDVCFFVYYYHKHGFHIDFDLLSLSLSHLARGEKIITPMEMKANITQDNAGDTTLTRYNAQLGNLRKPKLPPIDDSERRKIENERS